MHAIHSAGSLNVHVFFDIVSLTMPRGYIGWMLSFASMANSTSTLDLGRETISAKMWNRPTSMEEEALKAELAKLQEPLCMGLCSSNAPFNFQSISLCEEIKKRKLAVLAEREAATLCSSTQTQPATPPPSSGPLLQASETLPETHMPRSPEKLTEAPPPALSLAPTPVRSNMQLPDVHVSSADVSEDISDADLRRVSCFLFIASLASLLQFKERVASTYNTRVLLEVCPHTLRSLQT